MNLKLIFFLIVSAVFGLIMLESVSKYLNFEPQVNFLSTKSSQVNNNFWFKTAFYIHIFSSMVVWILGPFQLIPKIILNKNIHKNIGKAYILLILILAAPSGLVLGYFANGGLSAKIGFMLQSCVWAYFTYMAYRFIKTKNYKNHITFTLKSIAITYAAFSLRTESYLMKTFFTTKPIETYLSVVWLSWVGNLFLIEILLHLGLEKYYSKFIKP